MKRTMGGHGFSVIGENIHATRTLAHRSRQVIESPSGDLLIAFPDTDGTQVCVPLADPLAQGSELAAGRVKHVKNAVLLGLAGEGLTDRSITGPGSSAGAWAARRYLVHVAVRQIQTGADWLDVNVDEVAGDLEVRSAAMAWVVGVLEGAPEITVPLALDSSSSDVIRAGLEASAAPHGRVLLNSASLERLDVLELAAAHHLPAVLGAAGKSSLPTTADERVANADLVLDAATLLGLPLDDAYLDLLVIPAGVDPAAGTAYLEANRRVRAAYGPALHLVGGLSNVSFGLPGRRLLNDVFLALAVDHGVDSGIIDPVSADFSRIFGYDRDAEPFRLAADLLEGRDDYGVEYLMAFRGGLLAPALA